MASSKRRRAKLGMLLQAEVATNSQAKFEARYKAATGNVVSPKSPQHYQDQPNKWGSELRVYFNDAGLAAVLQSKGVHVEKGRRGYLAGEYAYRANNNRLWWSLVETGGLRLGIN